jgi:hypothetical protein
MIHFFIICLSTRNFITLFLLLEVLPIQKSVSVCSNIARRVTVSFDQVPQNIRCIQKEASLNKITLLSFQTLVLPVGNYFHILIQQHFVHCILPF